MSNPCTFKYLKNDLTIQGVTQTTDDGGDDI